ncbi:MAG: hypothetical protein M3Q34_00730 [bacterium]|nr:hypothetical protein [bacterium]
MNTLSNNLRENMKAFLATLGLLSFMVAATAFAGVGVGVAPDFPATATVGQTNIATQMEISNSSTSDIGSITLNTINLIPSCGNNDANTITCAGSEVDPGVFTVSATGTGSDACTGINFTTSISNVTTGEVLFTPSSPIILSPGAKCIVNFSINVNQVPVDDADVSAGLQTLQIGRVSATQTGNGLSGTGLGTDEVTVIPQGRIVVNKVTNPSGDTQSFAFTTTGAGYSGFSLTDTATPNDQALASGTYSVAETAVAGWTQTSAACVSSNQGQVETVGNISLQAGETVTCTFTNTKNGTLIVDKVTSPSGNTQSFAFTTTGSGYNGFSLTDTAAPNSQSVAPGTYSVAETAVAGWDQTSATCSDQSPISAVVISAGETVTCTFNNTLQQGRLIVDKVTLPAGDTQSFAFTTSGSGYTGFSLTDAAAPNNQLLNAGTYSVAETAVAGWSQTSATCSDQSPISAVVISAGETVTCTFTNTKNGNLIVDKVTSPSGSTQSFAFSTTGAGYTGFSLTDTSTPNSQSVVPGTYSLSEGVVAGWTQTSATCSDGSPISAVVVSAGETVTCTVTNTQQMGTLIVDKVTMPAGDTQSFAFTTTGSGYAGFSLTDSAAPNNQMLNAGTYGVSETAMVGWNQTSATCSDGSPISAVVLSAGETVTCTFTNTKNGTVIVDKVTSPSGSTQSFTFSTTGAGYNGFSLTDTASANSQSVVPGTYSVSEGAVVGWTQTSATCSDQSPISAIVVSAGETVTCTINNALQQGNIIIDKVTVPAGNSQSFAFTTTGSGYNGFSLTDTAAANNQTLNAGTYSVAETAVVGWTQTSATCSDGSPISAIVLGAGETVTCTITNTQEPGHLIVNKVTYPAGNTTSFTIMATGSGTITGGGAGSVTDAMDKDYTVTPGTYSVTETLPSGWTQTSNTCTGVVVGAGETKTCTITNTQVVQWCSHGYWKQDQHFDSWVGYSPNQLFSSVFEDAFPGMTLLQVLQQGGGGLNALGRDTVGQLLNSTSMSASLISSQVISMFNAVYPGSKSAYSTLHAQFVSPHNCPLN